MKYQITAAFLTEFYDDFNASESKVVFPKVATLEELIKDAQATCEYSQRESDYYSKLTMNQIPSVSTDIQDGEGYISISFEFAKKDFSTDMEVSYTVQEVTE